MGEATTNPVRLPPAPRIPKALQAVAFLTSRDKAITAVARRYGSEFTLNLPIFGDAVVISDPVLVKELFTMSTDLIARAGRLGEVLGPGSTFSLEGADHRQRRKLLVPPFHGKRMPGYEQIVEEEVLREIASWPEGEEFATMPSMMRITLNAILRAVFGADGAALEQLRDLLPAMVLTSSRLTVMPPVARRDYGPWSPAGRAARLRRRYDAIVSGLISDARRDAEFEERGDVLALLLRARYDDGSPISDDHVADELLTLLAAGHETTATTLAWAVERLRRHPRLLSRLAHDIDEGASELLQATIFEVQRTRPVIDATVRLTRSRITLGQWVIPENHVVMVSISLAHAAKRNFADPEVFDPDRFVGNQPDNYTWIPYGGGVRRCIGAAFANMEMVVVLRTLLRKFEFRSTYAPGESAHSRGVATAPARGGLAVLHRRTPRTAVGASAVVAEASA
ncbi:cytochrome P450 [Mycolicibacterium sp.]|uniref:cytochrome P450 n=1 Tax=Mycolicibacterium sp. TaxID=2320850 RepID=UPI001A2FF4ED|nr:cytochrome P450 [Mycolicibacterium sp.]MBJ7338509.1 cytochrome P450 [Mycolicibacterium sp.]